MKFVEGIMKGVEGKLKCFEGIRGINSIIGQKRKNRMELSWN